MSDNVKMLTGADRAMIAEALDYWRQNVNLSDEEENAAMNLWRRMVGLSTEQTQTTQTATPVENVSDPWPAEWIRQPRDMKG